MKFIQINEVQNDDCRKNDTYTTQFNKVVTYRVVPERKDDFIIKIKYSQNNNCSSSYDDKTLRMLTPSGWVILGTSYSISQEYPTSDQYDCRIDGITENCDMWFSACKKYFEDIYIVL